MSVTHLNNFLDTKKGGPYYFFEQNFLRFPQAKSAHTSYGTAMHETMQGIYAYLKNTGKKPSLIGAQEIFKEKLEQQAMGEQDFINYLEQGNTAWKFYIEKAGDRFDSSHWIETDFRTQNVMIEKAQITGKIDKIIPSEDKKILEVYDFKTGKPQKDWEVKEETKKIQFHNYKRQLIFYKLLIENSRDFHTYKVHNGYLEFLSPSHNENLIVLPYAITPEDVARLKRLIVKVYNKIQALDFVDINTYEPTLEGMIQFEDDLLNDLV